MTINIERNVIISLKNKSARIPDIRELIKKDKDLFIGYQSNIAMSFKDSVSQYQKKKNKKYLSKEDLHIIANKAAKHFLKYWIKQ